MSICLIVLILWGISSIPLYNASYLPSLCLFHVVFLDRCCCGHGHSGFLPAVVLAGQQTEHASVLEQNEQVCAEQWYVCGIWVFIDNCCIVGDVSALFVFDTIA